MLLIRAELRQSPIEGLGLFAREPLRKGTPIWRFMPGFDQLIAPEVAMRCESQWLERYAQECPLTGYWVLCTDDARFINHSEEPNMAQLAPLFDARFTHDAIRDIAPGEEITCDYRVGDAQPFSGFASAASMHPSRQAA